eukprot:TRINITY_DN2151_c0_g1_i1.p3 TRINITY_DN2151_c0_g1~~TRINITY_DN2151_c0_g1_i1.p3  ORF type:complete len:123 (-),score=18.96 TRINITY_DN2151_c0_g1_i1:326-694(-)
MTTIFFFFRRNVSRRPTPPPPHHPHHRCSNRSHVQCGWQMSIAFSPENGMFGGSCCFDRLLRQFLWHRHAHIQVCHLEASEVETRVVLGECVYPGDARVCVATIFCVVVPHTSGCRQPWQRW